MCHNLSSPVELGWLLALADIILASSGGGNQPADSAFTIVEKYVITSEEAYSCEEPEETIVLLAKVRRHSCHAEKHPSFHRLRSALPASCGQIEA